MIARLSFWLLIALAVLAPGEVRSDGGELSLRPSFGGEAAFLNYQREGLKLLANTQQPSTGLGRLGLDLGYGLTNEIEVGLGISAGFTGSQVVRSVELDGFTGDLYVDYLDLALPVSLSYQLNFGHEVGARVLLQGGPAYLGWNELGLVDPSEMDSSGRYARLPAETRRNDLIGFVAGAGLWVEWRPLDWLSVNLGPSAALRMAGQTRVVSVGVSLQPAFVFGVGPEL